ncbi:tetratricopeptide repeat protein [Agromyces ramosus]|uniref:Cytochrome c-type biogenesis protein CcmH/NrfG n=1 Tax=Agromyces ramosus TaxID=33879 RepID=A0ABU0RCB0_9MICO|nr:tetratricopeptide repeat protein [Agromyces ramosus]MDQ0895696.1 cytochrome c-type biogenesis protein CcmH/NrfG [Agromyces ramosus]
MTAKYSALLMAALLAVYVVLVGWRAVQFVSTGEPVGVAMGIALIVLPIIAAWAIWRELAFGIRSQALVKRLDAEGGLDLGLPLLPSGRPERSAATAAFDGFRADVDAEPASWRAWLRLGLAYDAAGDRRRARQAVRKAIELERAAR